MLLLFQSQTCNGTLLGQLNNDHKYVIVRAFYRRNNPGTPAFAIIHSYLFSKPRSQSYKEPQLQPTDFLWLAALTSEEGSE